MRDGPSTTGAAPTPRGPYAVGSELLASGDIVEAVPHLQKAAHFHPQNADVHAALAAALHRLGRWIEAREAAGRALALDPKVGSAWFILGEAHHQLDDPAQALNALETALQLKPRDVRVWTKLAEVYAAAGDRDRATALASARLRVQPDEPSAHRHAAQIAFDCGFYADALSAADRAEAAGAPAYALSGLRSDSLLALGRSDEAIAALTAAATARSGVGLYGLARAMGREDHRTHAELFAPITARLDDPELGPGPLYALGEHRHKLGDEPAAFSAFSAGAQAQWRRTEYDERRVLSQLSAALRHSRTAGAFSPLDGETASHRPIFILGMSRSGTTLTEQILAAHPRVTAGGELGTFGALAHRHGLLSARGRDRSSKLAAVREGYLDRIRRIAGPADGAYVTDKMPFNFAWIGPIAECFPDAPILLLKRDPRDVGWSNYRTLFRSPLTWSYDLGAAARYLGRFDEVCTGWLDRLEDRVRVVDYAALVTAPEREAPRLVADCGLDWRDECLSPEKASRHVKTASKFQVQEPINAKGLNAWRRYEPQLNTFIEALRGQTLRFAPID